MDKRERDSVKESNIESERECANKRERDRQTDRQWEKTVIKMWCWWGGGRLLYQFMIIKRQSHLKLIPKTKKNKKCVYVYVCVRERERERERSDMLPRF